MDIQKTDALPVESLKGFGAKSFLSAKNLLFLMALPCFAFVVIFYYMPIFGWIYAFFEYKPGLKLNQCAFVGMKYFKLALEEPELLTVLRNTFVLSFLGILATPLPAVFAIMLSEMRSKAYKKVIQTITTLPNFISWVLVYAIFFLFFSIDGGLVNELLLKYGIISEPTSVLGNADIVWIFQTLVSIWKVLGFNAIIYFAAIAGIDQELYDAANVDGAGRFGKILHITIPGLYSTFIVLQVLGIGNILSNGFDQFYIFHNAMVHDKIQVLDYYLYRIGIGDVNGGGDFSLATALGISKTFISLLLLMMANFLSKKLRGDYVI